MAIGRRLPGGPGDPQHAAQSFLEWRQRLNLPMSPALDAVLHHVDELEGLQDEASCRDRVSPGV
jgi:hypothetical protein